MGSLARSAPWTPLIAHIRGSLAVEAHHCSGAGVRGRARRVLGTPGRDRCAAIATAASRLAPPPTSSRAALICVFSPLPRHHLPAACASLLCGHGTQQGSTAKMASAAPTRPTCGPTALSPAEDARCGPPRNRHAHTHTHTHTSGCRLPPLPTPPVRVRDTASCGGYAHGGYHCCVQVLADPDRPCLDLYAKCGSWATPGVLSPEGECVSNRSWMLRNCKRSCDPVCSSTAA
jgi:hypothetical protein